MKRNPKLEREVVLIEKLEKERIALHTDLGAISTMGVERKDFATYWTKVFRLSMIANDLAAIARRLAKLRERG